MLMKHPRGNYRFMVGIAPYSCGVVAEPGHEIVFVTLADWLPWRKGFNAIDDYFREQGIARTSLCGIQLRCPAPFSMSEFIAFNQQYTEVLREWDVYVGDLNPIARTNVAPTLDPPSETMLHAFAYVRPTEGPGPSFVVAGAGELKEGTLVEEGIIRKGDCSAAALVEKSQYVMEVMADRLRVLGGQWCHVKRVNLYTIHGIDRILSEVVLPQIGAASQHGIHWYPTRPPVQDIEFEMDLRGVANELCLPL